MGKPSTKGFSRNVIPSNRQVEEADKPKVVISELEKELKPLLLGIIERAFKRYTASHGVGVAQSEVEWQRFKKILNGML